MAALLVPAVAQAAPKTYVANKTGDHAPNGCTHADCTLREAVNAANGHAGRDTIKLLAKTYTLAIPGTHENANVDGDLDVTDPVTIIGKGPTKTIVDGGGATVDDPAITFYANAGITGLTERNSVASVTNAGIVSRENLTMVRARVLNNQQNNPGCCAGLGVDGNLSLTRVVVANNEGNGTDTGLNVVGNATLSHVTVRGNHGLGNGSGVNLGSGRATLRDVLVRGNYGADCCNGLNGGDGDATFRRVVVDNNDGPSSNEGCCNGLDLGSGRNKLIDVTVSGNDGGGCCQGIETSGSTPASLTTIKRVTVSGNHDASGDNGCTGICTNTNPVNLVNVTVSGNSTTGNGAGIVARGPVFANNVTVTRNRADSDDTGGGDGGGIWLGVVGSLRIQNSIVAGNSVGISGSGPDCSGAITSRGHNLIGDTTGCAIFGPGGGDLLNLGAGLKPLRDNGGFTKTHALKRGSKALNHGSPKTPGSGGKACDKHDQRRVKRPQGPRCDIGAYERKRRHHH